MLALEAWRLSHCPGCGLPLDECTDIEMDGGYTTRNIRCHGCAEIARASNKFKDDDAPSSMRYVVVKKQRRG